MPSANSDRDNQRLEVFRTFLLSLGRVFQLHTLCWLQASFRDIGQNSALRRSVDSATCGPELKQSLGLKSACKKPPNGFKGAPSPAASQACDSQTSTRRLLWQLAALLSASQPLTGHFYRFRTTHSPLLSLPNCSQPTPIASEPLAGPQIASEPLAGPQIASKPLAGQKNRFRAAHSPLLSLPSCSQATPTASKPLVGPQIASWWLTGLPSFSQAFRAASKPAYARFASTLEPQRLYVLTPPSLQICRPAKYQILWGSKVLAKRLKAALRGPPSQQLRRSSQSLPSNSQASPCNSQLLHSGSQCFRAAHNRFLATPKSLPGHSQTLKSLPSGSQAL